MWDVSLPHTASLMSCVGIPCPHPTRAARCVCGCMQWLRTVESRRRSTPSTYGTMTHHVMRASYVMCQYTNVLVDGYTTEVMGMFSGTTTVGLCTETMMLVLATPQQWAHPQRAWHATYLVLRYTSCDAVSVTATTLQCPLLLDTVCLYRVHDDC